MEYGRVDWSITGRTRIGDSSIPVIAWEWHGPPVAEVGLRTLRGIIDRDEMETGKRFNLGPYPVKIIDSDTMGRVVIARTDKHPWLYALRYRLTTVSDNLTARIVLTLAIWGLAQWPGDETPTWRHVAKVWRKRWGAFRGANG